jgi:hypothetical protein
LFSCFPTKTFYAPPLSHMCYMTRQSYSSLYDHSNSIWRGVQIMKVFIMQPPPIPWYIVTPRPKYSQSPSANVSPSMRETKFNTHTFHTSKCSCLPCFLSLLLESLHNFPIWFWDLHFLLYKTLLHI